MKLLLLTATPMFNEAKEILWFINILLKNDGREEITEQEIFKDGNINEKLLIPALERHTLAIININADVFEKDDEQVKTKETEHINSNKYCLMIKEGHYYEPIVYRVNLLKVQYELKILSKNSQLATVIHNNFGEIQN